MEEEVQKLWALSKADRIQNADYVIGIELQNLYSLLQRNTSSIPENFEDLLLSLIVMNKGQISITNAHFIALCCIIYYKTQKHQNYWKLLPLLSDEIKKLRRPSIYILGLLSKKLCDGFKSQLPTPIQYLLQSNDDSLFPLICQCFRRIIKGTGTFLINLIPDIFGFIFAGSSSTNENIRIEAVKSIPALLEFAHISIKKLLPMVGQLLSCTSKELRYACAKSLAKLIYLGSSDTENASDNPFRFTIKIILQFAQNEKNIETLALTMMILMRYYQPIEIVKRLRTFSRFVLSLSTLSLPLPSLVFLSNGIFDSVISVIGTTAGNSLCHHLLDSINSESMTASKAMIALTALIRFDASTKTVATAAKQFYPLLSSGRKDIQKICVSFFAKLGRNEPKLGKIFIDTFSQFLATVDSSKVNEIDGFSKAAASVVISVETIPESSLEKVKNVAKLYLNEKENEKISTEKIAMSFLLLSSIYKKNSGYELIPSAFNFMQSFLINLSKYAKDPQLKKVIKFMTVYLIQIILNPPRNYEKLKSTIIGFITIILPNITNLSRSGHRAFYKLTRSYPECNEKIADGIVRSIVRLFPFTFSLSDLEEEYMSINSVDIGKALYNFDTPISHVAQINFSSLSDLFFGKLENDFYLNDLPFWVSKCSPAVLNEVIPPLFEYNKLGLTLVVAKLRLLRSILQSKRDIGLSKNFFEKMMKLETVPSQLLLFALSQTVAQWFISNPESVDMSLFTHNISFVSYVIGFSAKFLTDDMQIQSFLFLSQKVQHDEDPSLLFALNMLLTSFRFISDFSVQISGFLETLSYSDLLRKPPILKEFSNCVNKLSHKINSDHLERISQNLLHFSTVSSYAKLNGFLLSKSFSYKNDLFTNNSNDLTLQTPLPILTAYFAGGSTLDDVPLLFMMLQQSGDAAISGYILKVFESDCNVKKWTDFSKRIVIIGCVPPAERKGDIRIAPTSTVLICAIKITVLLVAKIRSAMELSCVDDIVSIAFNAIHMDDRRIDFHCFSILSSVITCFSDVRNQEGSLLDVYFSQFHPTFCHAVDGKHELQSVASFVIAYVRYVEDNRSSMRDEVITVLIDGLKSMQFNQESLTVFCRLASLIDYKDYTINNSNNVDNYKIVEELFEKAATMFIKDVLRQHRLLVELKDELPNFIAKISEKAFPIPSRVILALLLIELKLSCDSRNLSAVTNFKEIYSDEESIEFVLKIIANSQLLQDESVDDNPELNNPSNPPEDADLEEIAFWVVPKKRTSSINTFLKAVSQKYPKKLINEILTLSLHPPICFSALCHLAENSDIGKHALKIALSVLGSNNYVNTTNNNINSDECLALFKVLFDKVTSIEVIDAIVPIITSGENIDIHKRLELLRYAFLRLNGYQFHSAVNVVELLQKNLLPDGLNFLGSLLVSPKTALTAIYLLNSGLISCLASATISPLGIRSLPRILHFFNLAYDIICKVCDENDKVSFASLITRIIFVALVQVSNVKERGAVVQPACLLLKKIDRKIIANVYESGRLQKQALAAVTPQRQAATIQLLTFADVKTRKSSGWQSLDIDGSDSDE
ncbi:hypothetical protein TRFO_02521 [Tritrichomonas foetus]|uniref:HEAT repeat family protein n=1 Tax=Tritrichomonas foetus TaxID=1144522 RepID=A0A1J4L650_9EUKA|nr:hypothetical protein TRFO_02521 [Tritrichomonas foetus]|eukprot:OHT17492.1 hypothetical protein TRFO_02521 [Tritrichomonas foetus]